LRQLLQGVVGSLVDQVALLDPTFDAAFSADAGKALLAFQNLNPLAVLDCTYVVIEISHTVAQRGLCC
jgi:hypothetical protein